MAYFADWLQNNKGLDGLEQAQKLRVYASEIGNRWPQNGSTDEIYINAASQAFPGDEGKSKRDEAIGYIRSLWNLYQHQLMTTETPAESERGRWRWIRAELVSNMPVGAVILVAGSILITFAWVFFRLDFIQLKDVAIARGILMFMFGMTTVGIAIIIVMMVFLGSSNNSNELGERFQRGKDILTVLIGVFGAILGYYFGSDKGSQPNNAVPPPGPSDQVKPSDAKPPGPQISTSPKPATPGGGGATQTESR